MSNWAELINLIFRDCGVLGVGQTLQAQDTTDAVRRINMMLAQWNRRRWLVYHLVDLSCPMDGSLFYTLGVGGDIEYPRQDQVQSAYVRQINPAAQPNQPDYPLQLVPSMEDYSRITLKNLQAGPAYVLFFDSGYPLGKLYAWPLMDNQYELHIQVKAVLDQVTDITAEVNLPPEYEMAIYATQMKMTRTAYRLPPDKDINDMAKAALETLRSSNFQIGTLGMPNAVKGGGAYNVFSDTWSAVGR